MNCDELRHLLRRREVPNVEWKRQWYKNAPGGGKSQEQLKHELVKDILALANLNASYAGESGVLIIGAADELNADGIRDLFDISEQISDLTIRDIVNNYCDPPLENVTCEYYEVDGKRLIVITLLPTPYVYETTKELTTGPKTKYDKYTVFVRHASGIETASSKERAALLKVRQLRFKQQGAARELTAKIEDAELLCQYCGAPLASRVYMRSLWKMMKDATLMSNMKS